jgi:hypothetical protein
VSLRELSVKHVNDIVTGRLGEESIDHHYYNSEFGQIYFYLWSNKSHMSHSERHESNKKGLIIDFYQNDWIFVSILNENYDSSEREKHVICSGFDGLSDLLGDKREYLLDKHQ